MKPEKSKIKVHYFGDMKIYFFGFFLVFIVWYDVCVEYVVYVCGTCVCGASMCVLYVCCMIHMCGGVSVRHVCVLYLCMCE